MDDETSKVQPPANGPAVTPVVRCPNGHPSPAGQLFCGTCGARISQEAERFGEQPPSERRSPRTLVVASAGAVIIVLLAWFMLVLKPFGGSTRTIHGSLVLTGRIDDIALDDYQNPRVGDACHGLGGYEDIDQGQKVEVRDESNTLLGSAQLGPGKVSETFEVFVACSFAFDVDGVGDAKFYSIGVGRRGEVNYSKKEMESKSWHVDLSLGG